MSMETKLCAACGEVKSKDEFYSVKITPKTSKDGLSWQCKQCSKAKALAWNKANKDRAYAGHKRWYEKNGKSYYEKYAERHKKSVRKAQIERLYKITLEEYDSMFLAQNGVCAICKCASEKENLCIDHDHETGKVRGLLCKDCNIALGRFKESNSNLESAISYLKRFQ